MPLIDLHDLVRAGETDRVRSWLAEAGTLEIARSCDELQEPETTSSQPNPRPARAAVIEALS